MDFLNIELLCLSEISKDQLGIQEINNRQRERVYVKSK